MARSRGFDEGRALDAVSDVFWRKGYEGASYGELMAASGLGKGSLYAAWGDKAALYRAALERYVEMELGVLAGLLMAPGVEPRVRLRGFFDHAVDAVAARGDRRGCFLCNAAVDAAQADPAIAEIVGEAFATGVDAVEAVAAEAGAPGSGAHLFSVFLGLRVMARAGATPQAMGAARDGAMAALPASPAAPPPGRRH